MNRLSIIIPVFNEKHTVAELLRRVVAVPTPGYDKEIIVIDDGSTDGTGELLDRLAASGGFRLLRHGRNRGKGTAVRTGLERATGGLVLIQDADLEYDPADYPRLLAAFGPDTAAVYGSRRLGRPDRSGYSLYYFGGRLLTGLVNWLYGSRLTDLNTGYKLFRTDLLKKLDLRAVGFEFCEEATAKILRAGGRIREVPISYRPRSFGEGKKIRLWHGWRNFWTIIRCRLEARKS